MSRPPFCNERWFNECTYSNCNCEPITLDKSEYTDITKGTKYMPPLQGNFDATNIPPEQGIGKHPIGKKFPAVIKMTSCEPTKDNQGGYFQVTFETNAGQIMNNYNLWNQSTTAVEIAQKNLSALCHATGIFKLDFQNEGAALRGGQCMIDVDPDPKEPEKYVRITKIYDRNGNEPGKPPQGAPQTSQQWGNNNQQQQPMTQQQGGGWSNNQQQTNANPGQTANNNPAWSQQQPSGNNPPPAAPWGNK